MAERRNKQKFPAYLAEELEQEKVSKRTGKKLEASLNGWVESNTNFFNKVVGELPKLKSRNERQGQFLKLIEDNEIIICTGPAGCGKSYLSVYKAFELLSNKDNNFEQIVISTPAVEAEEKLGFLPGSIEEKLDPYVYSTYYLMEKLIGKKALKDLIEKKVIVIVPFAFMRGINIDNSIVLAEEIQNTSIKQIKTLLSRIGTDSKFIISGDMEQSDKYGIKKLHESGLAFAVENLQDISEIGIFEFFDEDIVRNKVISKILKRFKDKDK